MEKQYPGVLVRLTYSYRYIFYFEKYDKPIALEKRRPIVINITISEIVIRIIFLNYNWINRMYLNATTGE